MVETSAPGLGTIPGKIARFAFHGTMQEGKRPAAMRALHVAAVLGVTFASLLPIAAAATGPEFKPLLKKVIRARCHMDMCGWFSIEAAELIGSSPKGQLYKLTTKWWESEHKGGNYDRRAPRTGGEVATSFVFCSKQRPAWIDYDEDQKAWLATPLQPGNSNAVFGAAESAYAMYWAACHNTVVGDVYTEGDILGRKLGYRFSGDLNAIEDQQKLTSPEDVLNW